MSFNPVARLADNALEHSRAISIARRAIRRARAFKHRKFWYKWVEMHEAQMVSCAKMIIRINSIQRKFQS